MSGTFNDDGSIDWADGRIITVLGQKRTGKSVMANFHASTYPGDVVVIDVAGDDGPKGEGVHTITGDITTLPTKWPEHLRDDDGGNMILRFVPDPGSPTYAEDIDAMVGLAMAHALQQRHRGRRGALLLVHEIGVVAKESKVGPHMLRALMHNRHNGLSIIACGPRAYRLQPLVRSQADVLYIFRLASPSDRKLLADTVGWPPADFDEQMNEVRGHSYLRVDLNEDDGEDEEGEVDERVLLCPPLPKDLVDEVTAL